MNKNFGVLCHISSIKSKYGIGDFGRSSFEFVDFLSKNNINIWQVLPLCNTNKFNCPYATTSSLTFDEQYISPDHLVELGLVCSSELKKLKHSATKNKVNFEIVKPEKLRLLNLAYNNASPQLIEKAKQFATQIPEFYDYGYYRAVQEVKNVCDWHETKIELWQKGNKEYKTFAKENESVILKYIFFQYLLYTEWSTLKEYANKRGVKILGDMPIYPDKSSLDVLNNLESFKLDDKYMPLVTGGVPPDDFCKDGQNWGTCIYNWENLKQNGYQWIVRKINILQSYYNILRIDHFAGFVEYYEISASDKLNAKWTIGGGEDLFNTIKSKCDITSLVIEDLGIVLPSHKLVRDKFNLTGMSILQQCISNNKYLPQNVAKNSIYYLGTHDNDTYIGFLRSIDKEHKQQLLTSLGLKKLSNKKILIESVKQMLKSNSQTVVLQMQDFLMQNEKFRTNYPGRAEGCWEYKVPNNYKSKFKRNLKEFLK